MNLAQNPVGAYVTSSIAELRKVTWPSRKEVMTHTLIVVGVTTGVAAIFAGVDSLLNLGLGALLSLIAA